MEAGAGLFRSDDNFSFFFFLFSLSRHPTQNRDNDVSRRESFTRYRSRSNAILSPSFRATIFRLRDERRILRRVTAIAASRLHACADSCALADPKRATQADVEATGGLSRAVMDVGRLKFCEIPGSLPVAVAISSRSLTLSLSSFHIAKRKRVTLTNFQGS